MSDHSTPLAGAGILLTGASSGIGRALAVALAERAARLAIAARRRAALQELADEITAAGRVTPHVIESDLAQPGATGELAREALRALGGIDILINNAGAGFVGAQALIGDDESARALFETNFWAPLALTTALLPAMRQAGRGTIVNVTSTLQAVPVPLLGYYGATKAALAHATRTLRLELEDTHIRVLEVVPGATDTAARDIDLLPWRDGPMRTPPPVSPESTARAIVRALERGDRRVVHPVTSLLPLELPIVGRLIAAITTRHINTGRAIEPVP